MSDEQLETALPQLSALLDEKFDPEVFGFPWYQSIGDRVIRAVRSNQVIGLVAAAGAHLDALGDAAQQVRDLVGPNGRTMPTPAEVEERRTLERVDVEIIDALRAAGSLLDVLGGLAVLFLGLPIDPASADREHFLRCEPEPVEPSTAQAKAMDSLREVAKAAAEQGPPGWMEWTVESRNALVHRGRSIAMWLPANGQSQASRLIVVTKEPSQRIARVFPHLRRHPDRTDAEAILFYESMGDVYFPEPAPDTLDGLHRKCFATAGMVGTSLQELVGSMDDFVWPTTKWALRSRTERARTADAFPGFTGRDRFPPGTALFLNPRDAKRLVLMDKLRKELEHLAHESSE